MEPTPLPPPRPRPELVRTKLEMGGTARYVFCPCFWRCGCGRSGILVCNRHNETIGCLQNRARPRASEPGCDRSDRLTDFANRNRVGQQQCKRTNRPGEPVTRSAQSKATLSSGEKCDGSKGKAMQSSKRGRESDEKIGQTDWFFQTTSSKIEKAAGSMHQRVCEEIVEAPGLLEDCFARRRNQHADASFTQSPNIPAQSVAIARESAALSQIPRPVCRIHISVRHHYRQDSEQSRE